MHAEDLAWYHAGSLAVSAKSMNYQEPRSVVSVGSIIMTLTPTLTHIILPPFLQENSRELVPVSGCWSLCTCFHQLLENGSLMTIRVVTNLVTGEGQPVQEPSPPFLGVLAGSSLWIPGHFPGTSFLPNPKMPASIHLFHYSPTLSCPQHPQPGSSCSHLSTNPTHPQFTQEIYSIPTSHLLIVVFTLWTTGVVFGKSLCIP